MPETIHIEKFVLGAWQTNCFVVHAPGDPACWIVDAGFDPDELVDYIDESGLEPEQLVLTHAHVDHIAGIERLRARWADLPILIHAAEADFLTDPELNLSAALIRPVVAPAADQTIGDGDVLRIGDVEVGVRHTPGHSPGGVTLVFDSIGEAIVGDTLFAGGMGRFDFPTSDGPTLLKSIQEQILTLPDETVVHPGHGPATTVGREKASNPYLQPGAMF